MGYNHKATFFCLLLSFKIHSVKISGLLPLRLNPINFFNNLSSLGYTSQSRNNQNVETDLKLRLFP